MSLKGNEIKVLKYLSKNSSQSSKEIYDAVEWEIGYATLKRILKKLYDINYLEKVGNGKATKYSVSSSYSIVLSINVNEYFQLEIDERSIKSEFNLDLISSTLVKVNLFNKSELKHLNDLQSKYTSNLKTLSESQYRKELERLAIDLSWKSSQIEGNTYTLLETERLLKDKETALGKHRDEATMLLNHKEAIDFIVENPDYLEPLAISRIEDIHSLLMKDLNVDRNIRKRRVGISGTNYKPLDNEFQIRETLQQMCELVNSKENIFEKALLLLILVSYIQAFNDGNKRTARIVSNSCLINNKYCPISFRTIDSIEYKKAMLIFYEQNNISAFKKIFIDQFEFAVNTYF